MPRGRPSLRDQIRNLKSGTGSGSGASAREDSGIGDELDGAPGGGSGPAGDVSGALDPDTGIATGGDGTPARRGRGRPPGSGKASGSPKKAVPLNVNGVEKILIAIHAGVATFTHNPELALSDDEAKALAQATADVAKHYPDLPVVDPKWQAWGALAFVAFMIYRGKVTTLVARKAAEKHGAKTPPAKPQEPVVTVSSGAMPEAKTKAPSTTRQERDTTGFSFLPDFAEDMAA
jgi:hypothetical protein